MRSIIIGLIVILAALQYRLWVGEGGVKHWVNLENNLAAHEQENQKLASRNKALEADIEELKQGDQALEEQARFELGMVRDDEIYYQFVD
jgi:cell division protein FtsB